MNGNVIPILVVDDDEDDLMIIEEAFQEIRYASQVKKFTNGDCLFHYLKQLQSSHHPALIVLDNSMPKTDGSDILLSLKNNAIYERIRVVVYSAFLSPRKKQELLTNGAYECIDKTAYMSDVVAFATRLRDIAESNSPEGKAP